jgi:hypothetical protein
MLRKYGSTMRLVSVWKESFISIIVSKFQSLTTCLRKHNVVGYCMKSIAHFVRVCLCVMLCPLFTVCVSLCSLLRVFSIMLSPSLFLLKLGSFFVANWIDFLCKLNWFVFVGYFIIAWKVLSIFWFCCTKFNHYATNNVFIEFSTMLLKLNSFSVCKNWILAC